MNGWKQLLLEILARPGALAWRGIDALSAPARRVSRLSHLRARVEGPVPVSTQFDGRVDVAGTGRVFLGEDCRLGSVFFETQECGSITLGKRVRVNTGAVLVSHNKIEIGNDCLIGEYVSIRDANHGMEEGTPMRFQPHESEPIILEENVWIGRGACLLKGVRIGAGAVVGANSVVTHDVPARAIAAGSPARVLRYRR